MDSLSRAKQGAAALALILLAAFFPLACGPDDFEPGEDPVADGGDPLVDAGWDEDAAGEFSDAEHPGADAALPGADAAWPGADAARPGPDASRPPGRDAGPSGTGELADCASYPSATEPDEYSDLDGLSGSTLRNALYDRVKGHKSIGYQNAKERMFSAIDGFDVRDDQIECIYTGELYEPSQLDQTAGFNTEHSWPQSEFLNEPQAAKSDMHHLFPTEMNANTRRSSLDFGNTDCSVSKCAWAQGGSECGPGIVPGSWTVFEVRPAYRGDIARAHFYFALRYRDYIDVKEENTLRRWHRCDPPDAIERARNDAIEALQGNRNPFVDRPEFVDFIADF